MDELPILVKVVGLGIFVALATWWGMWYCAPAEEIEHEEGWDDV